MEDVRGYHSVVEKIIHDGKHGPYAVARCEELGSITFSLDASVWQGSDWPEPGMCVVLSKMRKKRAGWRATYGRFMEPSDEQHPATDSDRSKEQ
jgi:hypothetical protein